MPSRSSSSQHCFVFLEIFSLEGGIQSYVKDVLTAYLAADPTHEADVFLLRDTPNCANPWAAEPRLHFHYCKQANANLGRLRLTLELGLYLLRSRLQGISPRLFCGHVYLSPLVRLLSQTVGSPYTLLTYGKEVWKPLSGSLHQGLQQADQIWTISRYSRDRLCAAQGIPPERVHMLPCAVDGDRFSPGPPSCELRDRYGIGDQPVLMTVARLWSGDIYKGVDVTLRALPKLLHHYPDLLYLVIGRGDDQPRLAQLAEELGVAAQVRFAGFVATEELPEHYRLATGYVMPSQEGFGIVYLEAMATGVPVIAGDEDGSADPLQDGRVGWHVPHRDPDAVAQACLALLEGSDRRCDRPWLRQETLAAFSQTALAQQLALLLGYRS